MDSKSIDQRSHNYLKYQNSENNLRLKKDTNVLKKKGHKKWDERKTYEDLMRHL
jgi:hypothetical protein